MKNNLLALCNTVLISKEYKLHPMITIIDEYAENNKVNEELLGNSKFVKQLNRHMDNLDKIWDIQMTLKNTTNGMNHLLNNIFNVSGVLSLMEVYATFEHQLKELKKAITAASKQSEVVKSFYQRFDTLLETNVFQMMRDDIESIMGKVNSRGMVVDNDYSEYSHVNIELDSLLPEYRNLLKK